MSENEAQRELPKYKCHKEVHALKIKAVDIHRPTVAELDRILSGFANDGDSQAGTFIIPEDAGYARFRVDDEYASKHDPKPGGYFVVYDDGYKSYSPCKAFEDGYTKI